MDSLVDDGRVTLRGNTLLAAISASLFTLIFLPAVLYLSYLAYPPERTVQPRGSVQLTAAPGETVEVAGMYQILRSCQAEFFSMMSWETRKGQVQHALPPHAGSVPMIPDGVLRIARMHTIPTDALPGTQYHYRTLARWDCYPWLGPLSPKYTQNYADVVIDVR